MSFSSIHITVIFYTVILRYKNTIVIQLIPTITNIFGELYIAEGFQTCPLKSHAIHSCLPMLNWKGQTLLKEEFVNIPIETKITQMRVK